MHYLTALAVDKIQFSHVRIPRWALIHTVINITVKSAARNLSSPVTTIFSRRFCLMS
jgi:hypothetical protein